MKWLKYLFVLFLGFLLYPGLFLPLALKLGSNNFLDWYIRVYAEYLRLWGF